MRAFRAAVGPCLALVLCLVVGSSASAESADDHVTITIKQIGKAPVVFDGAVTSGDLAVTDDPIDTGPASIAGEATVPGAGGETAVHADVRRISLLPVASGNVTVTSPAGSFSGFVLSRPKRLPTGAVEVAAMAFAGTPFPLPVSIKLAVEDAGRTPGDHYVEIPHNGLKRFAVAHVPPAGATDGELPLILNLHGFLERHWMVDFFGETSAHADENDYLVVYPQSTGLRWLDAAPTVDDVGYLNALIDHMIDEFGADPSRVYVAGLSNGGFYTHVLACDLAYRLGAAVPVVGYLPSDRPCNPGRPLPITILNGTADPLVTHLEGRESAARWVDLNGCDPGSLVVTDLPDTAPNDGTTVQRWDWTGCSAPVVYYEVIGGGHLWYGHTPFLPPPILGGQTYDIDLNDLIWDFVSGFTAPEV